VVAVAARIAAVADHSSRPPRRRTLVPALTIRSLQQGLPPAGSAWIHAFRQISAFQVDFEN
jgi:hypothetical protein